MSLARDEVALRSAAASLHAAADALLAALSPAPVPAATEPTPSLSSYAPKVGDVVTVFDEPHKRHHGGCEWLVKEVRCDGVIRFAWLKAGVSGTKYSNNDTTDTTYVPVAFVRPATAAERAAAGLSVDAAQQPTPAYPVDDKGRPLWVRVTGLNGDSGRHVSVNAVYRATRWDREGSPVVDLPVVGEYFLCGDGEPDAPGNRCLPAWEPCAAHAETPAIAPTPAMEPRRTVGAVVKEYGRREYIVVKPGEGKDVQRDLEFGEACPSCIDDTFVRWATKEECARHGVPFVDRTPPAATPAYPVDAAGRPLWVRFKGPGSSNPAIPRKVQGWTLDRQPEVLGWSDSSNSFFGTPAALLPGEWEPCAAPTDAVTPAAALTEEERADLRDAIWKERTAWLATGADQRSEPDVYANAAAAWFAKRDGTVKP